MFWCQIVGLTIVARFLRIYQSKTCPPGCERSSAICAGSHLITRLLDLSDEVRSWSRGLEPSRLTSFRSNQACSLFPGTVPVAPKSSLLKWRKTCEFEYKLLKYHIPKMQSPKKQWTKSFANFERRDLYWNPTRVVRGRSREKISDRIARQVLGVLQDKMAGARLNLEQAGDETNHRKRWETITTLSPCRRLPGVWSPVLFGAYFGFIFTCSWPTR